MSLFFFFYLIPLFFFLLHNFTISALYPAQQHPLNTRRRRRKKKEDCWNNNDSVNVEWEDSGRKPRIDFPNFCVLCYIVVVFILSLFERIPPAVSRKEVWTGWLKILFFLCFKCLFRPSVPNPIIMLYRKSPAHAYIVKVILVQRPYSLHLLPLIFIPNLRHFICYRWNLTLFFLFFLFCWSEGHCRACDPALYEIQYNGWRFYLLRRYYAIGSLSVLRWV